MPITASGGSYSDLVAQYILKHFNERGVSLYREVSLGKSIIGKNRRVDILLVDHKRDRAVAIECKYQASAGTTDEKIPYAIQDMRSLQIPGFIVYAGEGFSTGVLHMLQASDKAVHCLPSFEHQLARTTDTKELDHMLAMTLGWWDVLVDGKRPYDGA